MRNDLRDLIRETYQTKIRTGDYPPDLKRFFSTHERRITFFNNLMVEFNHPKYRKLTRDQIVLLAGEMTNIFVLSAKRRADELNMSKIEQGMIKAKADKANDMRKLSAAMDAMEKTNVTQDKAGNETSKSEIRIDEGFV